MGRDRTKKTKRTAGAPKKAGKARTKSGGRSARPGVVDAGHAAQMSPGGMNALRDLFWCNVVRDMLNGLSILCQQQPELFDGRFGLLMRRGERIPVASVYPLFACSIPGTQEERDASAAVQCTVFQVTTPDGEVFTIPVHEVRAMHTMTAELIETLQKLAEEESEGEGNGEPHPFGLAAFAALPKGTGPGMSSGTGVGMWEGE